MRERRSADLSLKGPRLRATHGMPCRRAVLSDALLAHKLRAALLAQKGKRSRVRVAEKRSFVSTQT
jgi:hypothetical protein